MQEIRKNIIKEKGILYFDYTASGQAYKPIEKKMQEILKTYANTHSEVASSALKTSAYYAKAREDLKKALDIDERFYLFPCGTGATGAIKKFQELMGIYIPPRSLKRFTCKPENLPVVFVGPYEHHSNELSFREGLCELIRIPLDEEDRIDLGVLEAQLEVHKGREIIASFSVASNVTGIMSDYKAIYTLVKRYGGTLSLDSAAASPYVNIDCNYYDALFLSPHKLLGGVGSCGLLVMKKSLYTESIPTFAGGGTVAYVSRISHDFLSDVEMIEDAGTPGILQLIRASLAYNLRNEIGLGVIHAQEELLKSYFGSHIRKIDGVKLYCKYSQDKLPIFSLNFEGINPYLISQYLSDHFGIQTRAGCSCAGPYGHDLLELEDGQSFDEKPGWLRISIHYTHTKKEIDTLLKAIQEAVCVLKKES
ncbi:aminotransferase class V-fold PLP-dependent enzyme [Sulfurospirillum deleyianum]|uniref:Aminotransferase class V n=1 Tax=Sulfurospirillum deleyianum (strain ATCC 51133 / DSM 6946 / 5175) TaxID=525898 RepID=D1B053_SULD5|nr:aminotransferase class V-fold PLP-dependent enzyme [Sulfurospirillum deleyianum]ACZ11670.1 aminotransferase class V [Sulfurospirillum deleyianum DSM 6946]